MPEIIRNLDELKALEDKVMASAEKTIRKLKEDTRTYNVLFGALKFEQYGRHPTEDRDLNFMEQLNQTYTYLASIYATKWLIREHPNITFRLNLGTQAGSDIESENSNLIRAEVFSAVNPNNNNKLKKDVEKVMATGAKNKFVFYLCPNREFGELEQQDGVRVFSLEFPKL